MSDVKGKFVDAFIRALYYQIPGKLDITTKWKLSKVLSVCITWEIDGEPVLDQIIWLISTKIALPKKVKALLYKISLIGLSARMSL
jgi:hypothetical protein